MDSTSPGSGPDPWANGDTIATLDWESGRLVRRVDLGALAHIRYRVRARKCPRCIHHPCESGFCAGFEPVSVQSPLD